jgi:23S rRNA (pseudouridine1915-N3)-methyltransferase
LSRELIVVWAGRHLRPEWQALCERYRKRIGRGVPVRELPVKVRRTAPEQRPRAEAEAMLAALPDPVWLIALDPGGEAPTSERLAAELGRLRRDWPHPIAFAVGSDAGLDPTVLAAARRVLSLGPLTFPHELARLILYEQLYRALAIESGSAYHRGE